MNPTPRDDSSRFAAAALEALNGDSSRASQSESDHESDAWLSRLREVDADRALGQFGAYEVHAQVAVGGQGVVYRARQPGADRDVAIKRLRGGSFSDADTRSRFERELRLAAALRHTNIVRVYGVEWHAGAPLLIMEWIDGSRLDAWLARRQSTDHVRSWRTIVRLFEKLADATAHAHRTGIIHRDLKPSNVLIDAEDEPHILDFGLAHDFDPASTCTARGIGGTPRYGAPEQFDPNNAIVDVRADVFALGVMLYEALTGRLPYEPRGSLADTLQSVRTMPTPTPSAHNRTLPRDIDWIIRKAIAVAPADRYASTDQLAEDLRRVLRGEAVTAHPPSRVYRLRKAIRRHPFESSALLALAGVAIAYAIHTTLLTQSLRQRTDEAEAQRASAIAAHESAQAALTFLEETLAETHPGAAGTTDPVLSLLRRAEQRLATRPPENDEVAARIHFTLGRTYRSLWRGREAVPHLRTALTFRVARFGEQSLEAAECMVVLGSALVSTGDAEGCALQRRALDIRLQRLGDQHIDVADSRARYAYALSRTGGDFPAAESLMRQSVDSYRAAGPAALRDLGSVLHTYGYMLYQRRRTLDARPLYREADAVFARAENQSDPYYIEFLHGYAGYLEFIGDTKTSADVAERSIPLTRAAFGDAWTAAPLRRAAHLRAKMGDDAAARGHLDAAIALVPTASALGRLVDHPNPTSARAALDEYAALTDTAAADHLELIGLACLLTFDTPTTDALIAGMQQLLDPAAPSHAARLNELIADLATKLQRLDLAESAYTRAIELLADRPNSPSLANLRLKLGRVLLSCDRPTDALAQLIAAVDPLRQRYGEAGLPLRAPFETLIAAYEATGDQATARALAAELADLERPWLAAP